MFTSTFFVWKSVPKQLYGLPRQRLSKITGNCLFRSHSICCRQTILTNRNSPHRQTHVFHSFSKHINGYKHKTWDLDIPKVSYRGPLVVDTVFRDIHTSGRRDAVPPLVWAVVGLSGKIIAALSGRRWRQWVRKQPEEVRRKLYQQMMLKILAAAGLLSAIGYYYYHSHLQEAPFTGRKRFITLTPEQYLKVADFETAQVTEELGDKIVKDVKHYERIKKIMLRLVAANQDFPGMKDHHWTIYVIDDNVKNAFVLPNGHVFVYTGMLEFAKNDDQLGVVLGHEMAHALLQHAAEQLSYSQMMDYLVIAVMAAIWLLMPNDGIAVVTQWFYNKCIDMTVHKPYSRVLEAEADRVGLLLASKSCFDIREGSVFWNRMAIIEDLEGDKVPEWVSTHPTHDNRVKMINALIPKYLKYREECKCPRLPAVDPRTHVEVFRQQLEQQRLVLDKVQP